MSKSHTDTELEHVDLLLKLIEGATKGETPEELTKANLLRDALYKCMGVSNLPAILQHFVALDLYASAIYLAHFRGHNYSPDEVGKELCRIVAGDINSMMAITRRNLSFEKKRTAKATPSSGMDGATKQ